MSLASNFAYSSLLALLAASGVSAQTAAVTRSAIAPQLAHTWTDADFASAKPITPKVSYLPASAFDYNSAIFESENAGASVGASGNRGGLDPKGLKEVRSIAVSSAALDNSVVPETVGSGKMFFTSTRTWPNDSDTNYPTRTVGKLYFRDPVTNGHFVCSGAMIKRGVVQTSGHCLHDGKSHYYTDFVFRPGLRGGTYPYGTWSNWVQGRTTTAWTTGGGTVPNVGDWATIVFGPNASGNRIGAYTGWLGYQTNICVGRHQSVIGYPQNLDSGLQMHRVDAQANSYGSLNNCVWGSDMTGGSSGGPVVLNFQQTYTNTNAFLSENNSNRIVSTVSFGYTNAGVGVQGGAIFNANFVTLINATCAANPAACQ
jgi:V8-like Glu-specific endopeptidase